MDVPHGSALFVFSDGVYEVRQQSGERGTYDDFVEHVRSLRAIVESVEDSVFGDLENLSEGALDDDVSMLVVHF